MVSLAQRPPTAVAYGMHFFLKFLAVAVAVYLTVNIVPGIEVAGGWMTLLLVSLVWSVIITVIRPILQLLALPITIVTLGLFSFILNALLFWAMELIVPGFDVTGFVPALLGSIVLSLISWFIQKAL
jgi:putative membrane protein